MAEHKTPKNNRGKRTSDELTQVASKYKQSVFLKHRPNQAGEYRFGGDLQRFKAGERKEFCKDVLKDTDFIKQKKYFTIESKGGK